MMIAALLNAPLNGDAPLQQQLYQRLKQAILSGALPPQTRLPSSRQLAVELHVSRNTVSAVYDHLQAEGLIACSRLGSRVNALHPPLTALSRPHSLPPLAERVNGLASHHQRAAPEMALLPGIPALSHFPLALWRQAMNLALSQPERGSLGYGEVLGEARLRSAIADHLRLARGVRCGAENILMVEGAQQALELSVRLLTNRGDIGWVENPGYRGAKAAMRAGDMQLVPMPVDAQGCCPAETLWQQQRPTLIYTTPSHQYPLGSVLSVPRRLQLIAQARRYQSWIIEDDYDSEFRHRGEPLAAMQGLVRDAPVIYIGSFSKTLFPALRIGFMVLPDALLAAARPALGELLRGGQRHIQLALAEFMARGHYARHLSAMRRLYRERQQRLIQALRRHVGAAAPIYGGESGMHLLLQLDDAFDDRALAQHLRQFGLAPGALSDYWLDEAPMRGLLLGYGNTSSDRIDAAIALLQREIVRHTA